MQSTRRQLIQAFAVAPLAGAAVLHPRPSEGALRSMEAFLDLDTMTGFQYTDAEVTASLYVLKNGRLSYPVIQPAFLERVLVNLRTTAGLPEWRVAAARALVQRATVNRIESDEHWRDNLVPDMEARSNGFAVQRRTNQIARVTRRGAGNTLIGCKAGFERLPLLHYFKTVKFAKRIVTFESGEVTREPFVLIGYNGPSCYDTGLYFLQKIESIGEFDLPVKAALYDHDIEHYWIRIV